jgi:hypothetical protein
VEDEDDYLDWGDDEDDPCDHEDRDVDLLAGRACCYRCGEAWWLTDKELRREIELAASMFMAEEVDP